MVSAIICAAGSGERAGLPYNKIFYELNGMPVLCYSLSAFAPFADEILVACRAEDESRILPLLSPFPNARAVRGGETRFHSVLSALEEARGDIVLVHDAARPFVTPEIIRDCIRCVRECGSAVCALPATDTVAMAEGNILFGHLPHKLAQLPRKDVYMLQTPQGFSTAKLLLAYRSALEDKRQNEFTDDSGIYLAYVAVPHFFPGDRANRKLTYPEDFLPAERVGFGTDTHAFGAPSKGAEIALCGVRIPSHAPLLAHSDGDVAVHALMDALLSAIGGRDIGFHFPADDPTYEGADSMKLLSEVMDEVKRAGYVVKNACISVLAERPRLSPFIEDMRENLRTALDCGCVAVAAGTNEKLGYVGEGRGITACALVLLQADLPARTLNPKEEV